MSETESQTMNSEDDASTISTSGSESTMKTDSETETEKNEKDPWMPMEEEAMQRHKKAFQEMKTNLIHRGVDEQSAKEKAYFNVLPMLQKEL